MTTPAKKPDPAGESAGLDSPADIRQGWVNRRRAKIITEIERNRRGEYTVPTWVLGALLVVLIGGWVALIVFG